MKEEKCPNCGAMEFTYKGNVKICSFCDSKFKITEDNDFNYVDSSIALDSDIAMLLSKCKTDSRNASVYANLILDIDPTNEEAYKYL